MDEIILFNVHLYADGGGKVSLDLQINMTDLECPHLSIKSLVDSLTGPALLLPLHNTSGLHFSQLAHSSPSLDWLEAPQRESLNYGGSWYCKRPMDEN